MKKLYSSLIVLVLVLFNTSDTLAANNIDSTINTVEQKLETVAKKYIKKSEKKEAVIKEIKQNLSDLKRDVKKAKNNKEVKEKLEKSVKEGIVNIYANSQDNKDLTSSFRATASKNLNTFVSEKKSNELIEESIKDANWDIWVFIKSDKSLNELQKKYKGLDENTQVVEVLDGYYEVKVKSWTDSAIEKYYFDKVSEWEIPTSLVWEKVVEPGLVFISWVESGEQINRLWWMTKVWADKTIDYIRDNKKSDVVVAVVDTGIDYNHADLKANMWTNTDEVAGNGIDDDNNGIIDDYYGYNSADGSSNQGNPMAGHSHGTHCAGTVAAANNGSGVFWANPYAKLMAVKVFAWNGWSTSTYNIVKGIKYAADNGADVISMSVTASGYSSTYHEAVKYANNKWVIVIAAAWNNNADARNYQPASYAETITVAATDQNDNKASFSNYGNSVDIAAPWVSIYSTIKGGGYQSWNGTSMSTPMVAWAVSALIQTSGDKTLAEVKKALQDSWDDVSSSISGKRLNIENLLIPKVEETPVEEEEVKEEAPVEEVPEEEVKEEESVEEEVKEEERDLKGKVSNIIYESTVRTKALKVWEERELLFSVLLKDGTKLSSKDLKKTEYKAKAFLNKWYYEVLDSETWYVLKWNKEWRERLLLIVWWKEFVSFVYVKWIYEAK